MEPVNGQIKEGWGLRGGLFRALEKVNGDWHLITATHTMLKFFRFKQSHQQVVAAASGSRASALGKATSPVAEPPQ